MSFGLLFATTTSFDAFAQMNQTAQQANQTQANQTATTTTPPPTNQTSQQTNQSSSQQINATELLDTTNAAILALNEDDSEEVAQILALLQQQLINATGKQVVIVPSEVIVTEEDIEDAE